jgi:hypothetical protein
VAQDPLFGLVLVALTWLTLDCVRKLRLAAEAVLGLAVLRPARWRGQVVPPEHPDAVRLTVGIPEG